MFFSQGSVADSLCKFMRNLNLSPGDPLNTVNSILFKVRVSKCGVDNLNVCKLF